MIRAVLALVFGLLAAVFRVTLLDCSEPRKGSVHVIAEGESARWPGVGDGKNGRGIEDIIQRF
jgi:hypothetical protein